MTFRLVTLLVLFSAITANAANKRSRTEQNAKRDARAAARDQKRRGTGDGNAPTAKPAPTQDEVENLCAICHENMNPDQAIRTLACSHSFHTDCINTWFGTHNTCPTCRAVEPGVALPAPVGTPEIIIAARDGNLLQVQALIAAGDDVNTADQEGDTALTLAARVGHTTIVQALITAGANVNTATNRGNTALIAAALFGHTAIAQNLIAAGAIVNTANQEGGTALMLAAKLGRTAIVQALIAADANVNTATNRGVTALMLAAYRGHTEIVQALIAAGANVNTANNQGNTALIRAASRGHTAIVQALIAAGANVNTAYQEGYTPLILAANLGHTAIVQALLAHPDIDTTRANNAGQTALSLARTPEIRALIQAHIDAQNALAVAALTTTTE